MTNDKNNTEAQNEMMKEAEELLSTIKAGDMSAASNMINSLNQSISDSFYHKVGRLARELHESVKEIDDKVKSNDSDEVKTSGRLSSIIEITEKAANLTMDKIENTIPVSNGLAEESNKLLSEWGRLGRREMKVDEFRKLYTDMMDFLANVQKSATTINENLQAVLLAQDYQDLTGQSLEKVIALITELEIKLIGLISMTSDLDESYDTNENQNKNMEKLKVANQDEVDDLLSSLGF